MGYHADIRHDKFPPQGPILGKQVSVCFHYNPAYSVNAVCVRDDMSDPFVTMFSLDDGRYVLATECQYRVNFD